MNTLFPMPPRQGPSKACRLTDFIKAQGILTHRASFNRPDRYMALLPVVEDKGKDIGTIMAESCRLYDESNRVATGRTRLAAVRELCRLNNINCPL